MPETSDNPSADSLFTPALSELLNEQERKMEKRRNETGKSGELNISSLRETIQRRKSASEPRP